MELFVWSDRYCIGVDTVDAEHRRLFALINRLGELLNAPTSEQSDALNPVFKELADYIETHFANEERLMAASGIAESHFLQHVQDHREFSTQVDMMWTLRARMSDPASTLHGFLASWLTYHILGVDQAMARLIECQQRGLGPEEALRQEQARVEPTSDILLRALNQLYGVLSRLNRDLAAANQGLEERVAQRTAELSDTNRKLLQEQNELTELLSKIDEVQRQLMQSEKMASIGQLAAGVAHEINNPIGFVGSNLRTLERYLDELLPLAELGSATPAGAQAMPRDDFDYLKTDLGQLLQESQDGLERVRRIVADLKDFSRVGEGGRREDADLLAGLESTLSVAAHEIKYKADVVRALQPLPPVRCVPAQINQVFLNLLVNATQAIPHHGTITLKSGTAGAEVWIEVADTGTGMDAATQRRIFDPFFTTKPVGLGTGLGLSLSYDIIVNKHGGRIDVDSTPGVGTAFRIWLPIAGRTTAD